MCTAATYQTKDFYMGRMLDYEFSYGEEIAVVPRKFPLEFRYGKVLSEHYAMIGMAHMAGGYPLFYDAANEKGLGMAGLNFVGNAVYQKECADKENVAQFEFILWVLSQCASVAEARELLRRTNVTGEPFSERFPSAQLHYMIAAPDGCLVVECMADGMHVHENPAGVLTNNPPFDMQMFLLNQYMHLSEKQPENHFSKEIEMKQYSRGMGGIGLPGDLSSTSRFARVAFTRAHAVSGNTEEASVSQFFHILGSVDQQRGCCEVADGKYEITIYTSCCNTVKGIYYYTTYENGQVTAVDMHREDLEGSEVVSYPMLQEMQIFRQN